MREQGDAAAWCGWLLLFTALVVDLVTRYACGHPKADGDEHRAAGAAGTVDGARPGAAARPVVRPTTGAARRAARAARTVQPAAGAAPAGRRAGTPVLRPADPPPARADGTHTGSRHRAMAPGTACRAALSTWAAGQAFLLVAGALTGRQRAGAPAVLRAGLRRGRWSISPASRPGLLARPSALRV
ncbi:hypothetical protein ACFCVY_11180 [Streptomyces sp. NPDC056411]|uniref:hypothetical protein n=1 Tax=Streptomyces sp. NPDC056411 TaxID=3345813 RepID=UPI0035E3104A